MVQPLTFLGTTALGFFWRKSQHTLGNHLGKLLQDNRVCLGSIDSIRGYNFGDKPSMLRTWALQFDWGRHHQGEGQRQFGAFNLSGSLGYKSKSRGLYWIIRGVECEAYIGALITSGKI